MPKASRTAWSRPALIGERGLVDRLQVIGGDDVFLADVAEEGDLLALTVRDRVFAAADEHVRGKADALEFLDRVLGGLGLQLADAAR
jgi:hypothetical protein